MKSTIKLAIKLAIKMVIYFIGLQVMMTHAQGIHNDMEKSQTRIIKNEMNAKIVSDDDGDYRHYEDYNNEFEPCSSNDTNPDCTYIEIDTSNYTYPWLQRYIIERSEIPYYEWEKKNLEFTEKNLRKMMRQYCTECSMVFYYYAPKESENYLQICHAMRIWDAGRIYGSAYIVIRKDTQEELSDNIILINGKKPLLALIKKYLIAQGIEEADPEEFLANWHLAKNVIVFSAFDVIYPNIYVAIPVNQLNGIIREDILDAAREWPFPHDSETGDC